MQSNGISWFAEALGWSLVGFSDDDDDLEEGDGETWKRLHV